MAATGAIALGLTLGPGRAHAQKQGDDGERPRRPRVMVEPEARIAPSLDAEVMLTMPAGTPVRFVLRRGDWIAAALDERLFWLHIRGVAAGKTGAAVTRPIAPHASDVAPGDRVELRDDATLLKRRDGSSGGAISAGAIMEVHASARGGWLLVEDPAGALGWVRRAEVSPLEAAVLPGDEMEIAAGGYLRSRADRSGRPLARLARGDRLQVTRSERDWALVSTVDGARGWYPRQRLRRPGAAPPSPRQQQSIWQTGLRVRLARQLTLRAGPGPRQEPTFELGRNRQMELLRVSGDKAECWLLGLDDEGRWGWVDAKQVTPVELGEAVVVSGDGSVDIGFGPLGRGGRGAPKLTSLALGLRSVFPIGGPGSQSPRYEASAGISLRMPLGDRFGVGVNGFFTVSRSTSGGGGGGGGGMSGGGPAPAPRPIEGEGFRVSGEISYKLAQNWQSSLSGGYSFNVAAAMGAQRQLLRSRTGPFGRLGLQGQFTERWGVGVSANASRSKDWNGSAPSNTFGGEVATMLQLTERVKGQLGGGVDRARDPRGMSTTSVSARASVGVQVTEWLSSSLTGAHIGNDGAPVQVGSWGWQAQFFGHWTLQLSTAVERSEGATLWSVSTGTEVRF